jgi:hypothetical protein
MRNFSCTHCSNKVYFKNVKCLRCSRDLGFLAKQLSIVALDPVRGREGVYTRCGGGQDKQQYQYCTNRRHGACNWLTPAGDATGLCIACDLNRTIPNLNEPGNLKAWCDVERAKKRLVYSLLRFGLEVDATPMNRGRLMFDFVRNAATGHLDGVITIDIMEADAVERERQRQQFLEPYRSLLGHFRHESGHFYWGVLVEGAGRVDEFRAKFGDERQDYGAALSRHHGQGPLSNWQSTHVSAYASAHPWEDWAETWAHYLHMVDALDTAEAEGMEPRAMGLSFGSIWPFKFYDIYRDESFAALMERWIPLATAMNSLNRSMGHSDFYPFVIPRPAYDKLAFVHNVIRHRPR